jgi:tRNA(Arg) A34 adenosine deaminase TadA
MELTETDLRHLRRCVDLAREALEDGDEPFGSLLVDAQGNALFEDRNRRSYGDQRRCRGRRTAAGHPRATNSTRMP